MKIAIASGKGGTGKTTLSTNLALFLAQTEPTVLVDLDVEEPNSGLFIQGEVIHKEAKNKMIPVWAERDCNLCSNCQEVCNFNAILKMGSSIMVFPELCHGCYACAGLCPTSSLTMSPKKMGDLRHEQIGNLDFIESRLMISEEQAVPLIKQTIDYVNDHFNEETLKIFDSPPGTSCPVIEVTRGVDLVLLVTEPTPFGLHDLKLAVDTVRKLGKEYAVVLNRYGIGNDQVEQYCAKEEINLLARIPNSRRVAEIYAAGGLLYQDVPEVAAAIQEIADFIRSRRSEVHP